MKYNIGDKFINKSGLEFTIIGFGRKTDKNSYYKIKFTESGYIREAIGGEIQKGTIKDYYTPTVRGVGIIGDQEPRFTKDRIYSVWKNMIERCYNENFVEYKRYGAKGIRVCERWHRLENFQKDIKTLDGWNEELFYNRKIFLDKDKKQMNKDYSERIYSPETCIFLTSSENGQYTSTNYRFDAIDPDGNYYIEDNLINFCKEHNLPINQVYSTINGWQKSVRGWKINKIDF